MQKNVTSKFYFLKTSAIALLFLFAFANQNLLAQSLIFAGNDTVVCSNSPITLTAITQGELGTSVTLSDDQYTGVIPLGFSFDYFGAAYTQCLISSNNYITFNTGSAGVYSPWSIVGPAPGMLPAELLNSVMGPWQDILPPSGGAVRYAMFGTAPNRIFVTSFCSVAMFSCTTLFFTSQIKLFEGTNEIETHIGSKPLCPAWNSGQAIHGIVDITGTNAYIVPGRNAPTQWTVTSDGYRFTPTGASTYSMTPIPFNPSNVVSLGSGATVDWTLLDGTPVGTGFSIVVQPTQPTYYIASVEFECSNLVYSDTVLVGISNTTLTSSSTDVLCNGDNTGTALAEVVSTFDPFNYVWENSTGTVIRTMNGVNATEDSISGLVAGNYTVELTDSMGCVLTEVIVIDEPTAIQIDSSHTDILCNGETNGTATVVVAGGTPPYVVDWNDPANQTGNNANNLAPGNYTATVTDDNGCILEQDFVILQPTPLVLIATSRTDTCEQAKGTATVSVSGGTSPYNYIWQPVAGNDSLLPGLLKGNYSVLVTDDNGCTGSTSISVGNIPSPIAEFQFSIQPDDIFKPLVYFDNESEDANTYFWDFGDEWNGTSTDTNPTYRYDTARTFPVILVAYGQYDGCIDTAIHFVTVNPVYTFYIPNAFTPGSVDDLNDTFGPVGNAYDIDSYYMTIYDRWGSLIFQTNDFKNGQWNGQSHNNNKPAPDGVYVYRIDIKTFSGFNNHKYVGTVALIRQR